MDDFV
jgi:arginine/serine-rich splicing factor 7